MTSILKVQLFRLKKSKLFWTLLIVTVGLSVLTALLLLAIEALFQSINGESFLELVGLTYSTTAMLSSFASFSFDSALLAMICSAIILSREFRQGTMRNTILANKSRKQLFFSYYIIALLIGVTYFLVEYVLSVTIFGLMIGFGAETAGTAVSHAFMYFALGLCSTLFIQTCVCMFMFVTRRQSLTIVLPLLICLIAPSIITGIIETILFAVESTGTVVSDAALACIPFYNVMTLNPIEPSGLSVGMIALYDLLFAGMFFVCGFFPFQKADLK